MSTAYPTSLDVYIARTNKVGISENSNTSTIWASTVNNIQDAITAIETVVGLAGSSSLGSHEYLIKQAVNPGHTHTGTTVSLSAAQSWTATQTFSAPGVGLSVVTNASITGLFGVGAAPLDAAQTYLKSTAVGILACVLDSVGGQTANILEARVNGVAVASISPNGTVVSTGVVTGLRTVTTTTTLTVTDSTVLADATGGSFTITLPPPVVGQEFTIKQVNATGGNVTVSAGASQIDGSTTAQLIARESLTVVSNGTNWFVV